MNTPPNDPPSQLLFENDRFYTEAELDALVEKHASGEISDHQLLRITKLFSYHGPLWEAWKEDNPRAAKALAALSLAYCEYSYPFYKDVADLKRLYYCTKESPTFEYQ
jgi:hypothetical protein